jgi:non-ribosomal peptide synthetase component F
LGILKAGAAFLILDPAYPASRILDCIQQAKPRGWLHLQAAGRLPDALKEFTATLPLSRQVELPRTSAAIAELFSKFPVDNPGVRISPDSLAYVSYVRVYGRPKDVLGDMVPHLFFALALGRGIEADRLRSL